MAERTTEAVSHVKDHAATLAQAIIEQAANRAVANADRAKHVAAKAKGRVSSAQKASEEVVPSVREIALQAASAALDLWQAARERAEEGVESAEHAIVDHASGMVSQAEKKAKHAAEAVGVRAGEFSEHAKEATKSATDTTVHAGKDTGAAIFWTVAAAGVVFYALLDKNRREQVLRVVDTVVDQAREIIRDFQGYDEEFI